MKTIPVDLSNLSDLVKKKVVKKDVDDKLSKNVDEIQAADAGRLVEKTMTQKLVKLNRKHMNMIMLNISLLKNLIY